MSFKQQAGGVTGVVMVVAMMMTLNSGTYTQVHTLRYTLSGTHSYAHTQVHLVQLDWHTSWTFKKGLGTSKLAELKGLSSFEYKFFWVWVNAGN